MKAENFLNRVLELPFEQPSILIDCLEKDIVVQMDNSEFKIESVDIHRFRKQLIIKIGR